MSEVLSTTCRACRQAARQRRHQSTYAQPSAGPSSHQPDRFIRRNGQRNPGYRPDPRPSSLAQDWRGPPSTSASPVRAAPPFRAGPSQTPPTPSSSRPPPRNLLQQRPRPTHKPDVGRSRDVRDDAAPKQVNYGSGSAMAALAAMRQKQTNATNSIRPGQSQVQSSRPPTRTPQARVLQKRNVGKIKPKIELAAATSVENLAGAFNMKLRRLQLLLERMGVTDHRPDRLLNAEDASLVASELGFEVDILDGDSFDIVPSPSPSDFSKVPLRPPIVTIMGHVDHGKTSLLDALRATKVAAGEAGGITQHIGAFNVPLSKLQAEGTSTAEDDGATVTFLDTPGHAAFTAMRSRGAAVTDIVVLVVAADDGVKPQTEEVIKLIKGEDVGLVVAVTKCDKPQVDVARVHNELFARGIEVEDMGGDVPCVSVSAHSRLGLDDLVETISTIAEIRDLRAEREGVSCEARVIESQKEQGRGNVTTLVVTRGTLRPGQVIIAGQALAKVRQLFSADGSILEEAPPGTPVQVTGWRDLPEAGDDVLEAANEEDAKRAIETRKRKSERRKAMTDLDTVNERRRLEANAMQQTKQQQKHAALSADKSASVTNVSAYETTESGRKELRLIVKADFSGTVEAVSASLGDIGNTQAGVKIIHAGAGEFSDGDLTLAQAVDGILVGFNIKASRQMQSAAALAGVPIVINDVIYRLIDDVKSRVIELLPKIYDTRVLGEASVLQIFELRVKGAAANKKIAGCRVSNGLIQKKGKYRVLRDREVIFDGELDTLKHLKDDVDEVRKGTECGLSLAGFSDWQEGDALQCYEQVEKERRL